MASAPVTSPSGRESRLALSGLISLLGSSVSALGALAVSVVVVRALGAEDGGVFFQAVGLFAISIAVLKLGTHSGLVRSIARQNAFGIEGSQTRSLLVALVPVACLAIPASAGIFFAADPLAGWLGAPGKEGELATILRLLAPFIAVGSIMGVLHTGVRMMRSVPAFSLLQDVAVPTGRLAGVMVAWIVGWNVIDTVGAWVAALPIWLLVTAGVLAGPIQRDLAARRRKRPLAEESYGEFWRFSAPRAVGVATEIGLEWADVLIVAATRSAREAGIYAIATRAVNAGRVVDQAARVAASPSISRLLALGDLDGASRLHTDVTKGMVLLAWPFYLTLVIMGPAILSIFGPEFDEGAQVLALLGVVMMGAVTAGMLQSILLMGGKSSWQVYNKGLALALSIGLNLWLVPEHGITGAAVTWAVVVVVDNSVAAWLVHVGLGVHLAPQRLLLTALVPLGIFGIGGLAISLFFGTELVDLAWYGLILVPLYLATLVALARPLGLLQLKRSFSR